MASNDIRSYAWTYIIAGSAFVIGGVAMVLDGASSKMYLVALIAGPIMLVRGILLLKQKPTQPAAPAVQPAAEVADSAPAPIREPVLSLDAGPAAPELIATPEPAWLRNAFSAHPLRPILPTLPAPSPPPDRPPESVKSAAPDLWGYAFPCAFFLGMVVLVVFITPTLLHHWRISEARSEADAAYLKRKAELQAESEHGDAVLRDNETKLMSLGFRALAQKVKPMVVTVSNLTERPKDPFARTIYDPHQDKKFWVVSVGTGFIARPGYILTNYHVVKQADQLRVTMASGQSIFVPASKVASDSLMDLAVIHMPANEAMNKALDFADSDKDVHVGDVSLTIGSPLGLEQTVTHGIISAKGRLTNWLPAELLQTDTPIHPGNSGGPLLDLRGRVVGVNVAIASENGRNQGIAFAIPSNAARKIFEKLVSDGEVARGFLGVSLRDLGGLVQDLGKEDLGAVLIEHVFPHTAASKAGLRAGDIVVRFNNEALAREQSYKHLQQLVSSNEPGTEISLEVLRNGQRVCIPVVLGRRPKDQP